MSNINIRIKTPKEQIAYLITKSALQEGKITKITEALKDHSTWQKEQYKLRDIEISELKSLINTQQELLNKMGTLQDFDNLIKRIKSLEEALERGTAVAFHVVYHETINTRIRNICNALGMDLNGIDAKQISELNNKINCLKGNLNNRQILLNREVLQKLLNNLYGKTPKDIIKLQAILESKDGEKPSEYRPLGINLYTGKIEEPTPSEPKYLNPQLQCNGECHDCDDNIPSDGVAPNQCGRLKDGMKTTIEFYEGSVEREMEKYDKKPSRRSMKCCICYSDELGKMSDIENSDKRFEALNDFFLKIQEIVRRETEIEFLRKWRKFMK